MLYWLVTNITKFTEILDSIIKTIYILYGDHSVFKTTNA